MRSLQSHGIPEATTKRLWDGMLDVRAMQDPALLLNDPKALNALAWKTMYGMDTEVVGDAIKVTSIGGESITPQVFANDTELSAFINTHIERFNNEMAITASKIASNKVGTIKLDALSVKGKSSAPLSNDRVFSVFRPDTGDTSPEALKELTEQYIKKDFKIQPLDDYFTGSRRVVSADGTIYVPTKIANGAEAQKFADDFFDQLGKLSEGNVRFNTDNLGSLLRDSGAINYKAKGFLKRMWGASDVVFHEGGAVDLKRGSEVSFSS